ncbi:hypothetical protein [Nocardia aurantiaca]|uniref:DUF3558 domain-containing protein n=1 Tax=Nocardia aurantiaca TaxID=2675850 RepID=A0A6I3L0U6_9NOCA|nr:hypothetical protein [Nocardia aurantiaca]MTE14184.1 hypothetical protein [Nocardia aurantiaca]
MLGQQWQPGPGGPVVAGPGAGRRPGRRSLLIGMAAAAVVLLAAGTGVYFGVVRPDSHSTAASGVGGHGFADLAHLDTCSFVTRADFSDMVDDVTDVTVEPSDFDTCEAQVDHPKGGGTEIDVDFTTRRYDIAALNSSGRSTINPRGALHVGKPVNSAQDRCDRLVYRDDGVGISVGADSNSLLQQMSHETISQDVLCRLADKGIDIAVAALTANTAGTVVYPADSFGGADPCGGLTADDVRAAIGTTVTKDPAGPAHDCRWMSGDNIVVTVGARLTDNDPMREENSEQVAGRTTYQRASQSGTDCTVVTKGRHWDHWLGKYDDPMTKINSAGARTETMVIRATPSQATTTFVSRCAAANALAAKVWPTLPKS